jgi:hypothetical protein
MTSSNGRLQPCFCRFIVLHIMAVSAVVHFGPSTSLFGSTSVASRWFGGHRPSTGEMEV